MRGRVKYLVVSMILGSFGLLAFQNCAREELSDRPVGLDHPENLLGQQRQAQQLSGVVTVRDLMQNSFDSLNRKLNALEDTNPENGDMSELSLRDKCSLFSSFGFTGLYLDAQAERANAYLHTLVTDPSNNFGGRGLPQAGGGENQLVPCSGVMQHLARIALDGQMAARLSVRTRAHLRNALWRYVYHRSKVSLLSAQNIWTLYGTENHHSLNYGAYYLALLELSKTKAGDTLADGHTVTEHIAAWNRYWKWYLQGRANKGLHVEVRSTTYAQYTLITYYNLRDLSPDAKVRRFAHHFLTLNWADVAQEFLKDTGVSGGASIRTYRDAGLVYGRANQIYHLSYVYGWHDIDSGRGVVAAPPTYIPLVSSYRPPEIVTNIATSTKPPFHYFSRRIGRQEVPAPIGSDRTDLSFGPNGETSLLRYSYVTPDYVLGAMAFDPSASFSVLTDKERAAGVVDASAPDARLMIVGRSAPKPESEAPFPHLLGEMLGRAEILSIGLENTLIVARDVKASVNDGQQIFISNAGGLADPQRLTADETAPPNQWIFTRSERAYYAFRFPCGFTKHEPGIKEARVGISLHLADRWAPIVVQVGRISDYSSENAFRQAVVNQTQFNYNTSTKKLEFTDMRGRRFEYWAQSSLPPKINGRVFNFDPPKTYSSPYITSNLAENKVELRFAGESQILDFN